MTARIIVLTLLTLAVGCTGSIDGAGSISPDDTGQAGTPGTPGSTASKPGGSGTTTPSNTGSATTPTLGNTGSTGSATTPTPGALMAGPLPLLRLSRDELNNTLRDLLGDGSGPASVLPVDRLAESRFPTGNLIDDVDAQRLFDMTTDVAAAAMGRLGELSGCDAATRGEPTCAQELITRLGKRAWRRPLEAAEVATLRDLYTRARAEAGLDHPNGLRVVLQAMLLSPNFLYHWEVGPKGAKKVGALVKLGPYEVASRLSYFLWKTMPDADLFAAADANKLETEAEVTAQAQRMLKDKRAERTLIDFHTVWMHLEDLPDLQKGTAFNADAVRAARTELEAMVTYVLAGDGTLQTLLTAPIAFPGRPLAKFYGLPNPSDATVTKADVDPSQRAGIFTQVGFLARNGDGPGSHPIKRGIRVLESLLCEDPPPPLPMVPEVKPPAPNLTTRERFAEHASNGVCVACHQAFDPLGFAFENYDGYGQYRTMEGTKPVDTKGELRTPSGLELQFDNAVDLMKKLAANPKVQSCFARQAFRLASGRMEIPADARALDAIDNAFGQSGFDIRALVVAVTTSPSFLYRAESAGEVLQ